MGSATNKTKTGANGSSIAIDRSSFSLQTMYGSARATNASSCQNVGLKARCYHMKMAAQGCLESVERMDEGFCDACTQRALTPC